MDFKLLALTRRGFQPQTRQEFQDGNEICVRQTKRHFAYYKNGYFRYINRDIAPFAEDSPVDTVTMKEIAFEIQKQLIPPDKSYRLISKNETFVMKAPSLTENLAYVSYRFVRVLNSRLVLGLTDELEITLGKDGKLKEFISYEPEYEPVVTNTRTVVKPQAYEKILRMRQNNKDFGPFIDGKHIDFDELDVDGVTDAYFQVTDAGNKVIVPYIAVLMSYNEGNEKMAQEAFLSLRAEDWSNLADADVEVVRDSNK